MHTSTQPYEMQMFTAAKNYDSLISSGRVLRREGENWFVRKLFSEHLFEVSSDEYRLYFDINADLQVGRDFEDDRNTLVNTRGFYFGGTVYDNVSFYTEFFENQAKFPKYLDDFIKKDSVVPGQGFKRLYGAGYLDYAYSSAVISYRPSKFLSLQGGHGKNFIGDGYRSLLLSDNAFNYPYFKITADIWKIQYTALWTEFQNIVRTKNSSGQPWDKKAGVFHYLDVNITNRLSVGIFEGIIWQPQDSVNNRGIEWNYLNPIIFLRPVEFSVKSPDNVVLGLNTKYILTDHEVLYGQFMIDEMTIDEFLSDKGYWGNKYGVQLGVKSINSFNVSRLYVQGELNIVSPFTYSHREPLKNYAHYRQSLAHPLGANFYEGIGILSYSIDRFEFRLQVNIAQYGTDSSISVNYGQDVDKSYDTRSRNYGNFIGQGVNNELLYSDIRVAYVLNPLSNLRFELCYTYRSLTTGLTENRTSWITAGIRTSFRNLYYDF